MYDITEARKISARVFRNFLYLRKQIYCYRVVNVTVTVTVNRNRACSQSELRAVSL
jgi:hypothetical protein